EVEVEVEAEVEVDTEPEWPVGSPHGVTEAVVDAVPAPAPDGVVAGGIGGARADGVGDASDRTGDASDGGLPSEGDSLPPGPPSTEGWPVAGAGTPLTEPSGLRKAGVPPGTIPSSRARRSSSPGAESLSTSCWRAWRSSVSSLVCFSSLLSSNDPWLREEFSSSSAIRPEPSRTTTSSTKGVRLAVVAPGAGRPFGPVPRALMGRPLPGCAPPPGTGPGRPGGSRRSPPRWAAPRRG